ncbi:MAG: IclR family transcriptional regulator [Deltaproteobacteria bacterium]|nr:IclR family transcriptional regulator [Deltaproteobacteria bacterium]
MRSKNSTTNAIDKTLLILSAFAPHNHEWGTIELSQALGLHKATVSRILLTLTRHGFLLQDPRTRKFTLGPAVMRLSRALRQSLKTNLVQVAKPFVDALRDTLKETVNLELLSGNASFMAYIAEGPRMVRLAGAIGDPLPIHAAAGAKAIVAFLPAEHRERLLRGELRRFTQNTITSRKQLERELAGIRKRGVAQDREEIDEGTGAVACPVFDHEHRPVASLVVAGPHQRIEEQSETLFVPALKEAAAKISRALLSEQ